MNNHCRKWGRLCALFAGRAVYCFHLMLPTCERSQLSLLKHMSQKHLGWGPDLCLCCGCRAPVFLWSPLEIPVVTAAVCTLLCVQLQKPEASEVDEVDEDLAVIQPAKVYGPKSLVLVSRLDYTEVFRVRYAVVSILHNHYTGLLWPLEYLVTSTPNFLFFKWHNVGPKLV